MKCVQFQCSNAGRKRLSSYYFSISNKWLVFKAPWHRPAEFSIVILERYAACSTPLCILQSKLLIPNTPWMLRKPTHLDFTAGAFPSLSRGKIGRDLWEIVSLSSQNLPLLQELCEITLAVRAILMRIPFRGSKISRLKIDGKRTFITSCKFKKFNSKYILVLECQIGLLRKWNLLASWNEQIIFTLFQILTL